jgi:N-acetylmuramoyl-L-alanine amidase
MLRATLVLVLLLAGPAVAAPPTVVVDPGHGGSNTGARARVPGVYEKHVTLAIARALANALEPAGVRVILTRSRDEYLTLRERGRRANAAHPDCFLSLHANASPEHGRRGVETFVLAREAAEVEARRSTDGRDGVEALLAELERLEAQRGSAALAHALQARLAPTGTPADRGVKQAAYDVLAGVHAPAALVEVGFIDHPVEGAELLRPEVQRRIAAQLADGILDFVSRAPRRYAAR